MPTSELNLKLSSGVFGSTFFMLTGFHGFHVFVGMLMLLFITLRLMRGPLHARAPLRLRRRGVVLALRRRGLAGPVRGRLLALGPQPAARCAARPRRRRPALSAHGRSARPVGLDPAHPVAQQDEQEQQHRQGDPQRPARASCRRCSAAVAPAAQHEEAGDRQGAEDADEGDCDHGTSWLPIIARRCRRSPWRRGLMPCAAVRRASCCCHAGGCGTRAAPGLVATRPRRRRRSLSRPRIDARATPAALWLPPIWPAAPQRPRGSTTAVPCCAASGWRRTRSFSTTGRWTARPGFYRRHALAAGRARRSRRGPARLGPARSSRPHRAARRADATGPVEVAGVVVAAARRGSMTSGRRRAGAIRQNLDLAAYARETGVVAAAVVGAANGRARQRRATA